MNYRIKVLSVMSLMAVVVWNCDQAQNTTTDSIKNQILSLISSEDTLYEVDDVGNVTQDDWGLSKTLTVYETPDPAPAAFDSQYVWRFWRTNMSHTRVAPEVQVENDSLAYATLTANITGIFHALQRERIWTSATDWVMGDTISLVGKPIAMTLTRHVRFQYLPNRHGVHHWVRTGMTPVYGGSDNGTIEFNSLRLTNLATDSSRTLVDFENTYISMRAHALTFHRGDSVRVDLFLTMPAPDDRAVVRFKWDFQHQRPVEPARQGMRYLGTDENGRQHFGKVSRLMGRDHIFKAYLDAVDTRTLFDPDYAVYNSQILGFHYMGRAPRHH